MACLPHPYQSLEIDSRVKNVLKDTPLFDGHNDLPQQPRACFHGKVHNNPKFDLSVGFQRGMTDIPRLREGAVGAQFWSICVLCLRSAENFSTPEYSDMARDAIEQIDMTTRMVQSYPDVFEIVLEPQQVKEVYARGKIACSMGIDGCAPHEFMTTVRSDQLTGCIWPVTVLASSERGMHLACDTYVHFRHIWYVDMRD